MVSQVVHLLFDHSPTVSWVMAWIFTLKIIAVGVGSPFPRISLAFSLALFYCAYEVMNCCPWQGLGVGSSPLREISDETLIL